MRKLLIVAAVMAIAFVAPVKAEVTPKAIAEMAAMMVAFDEKCGGLPPQAQKTLNILWPVRTTAWP